MKFLIQKSKIPSDFEIEILKASEYYDWVNQGKSEDLKVCIDIEYYDGTSIDLSPYRGYCPIGSVEFVNKVFKDLYGKEIKPLNVPEDFWKHEVSIGRYIGNYKYPEDIDNIPSGYVKSMATIKSRINGTYAKFP